MKLFFAVMFFSTSLFAQTLFTQTDCDTAANTVAACKLNAVPIACPLPASVITGRVACITPGGFFISKIAAGTTAISYNIDGTAANPAYTVTQNVNGIALTVASPQLPMAVLDGLSHTVRVIAYNGTLTRYFDNAAATNGYKFLSPPSKQLPTPQ